MIVFVWLNICRHRDAYVCRTARAVAKRSANVDLDAGMRMVVIGDNCNSILHRIFVHIRIHAWI